jgi:uncharacterized membrane protein
MANGQNPIYPMKSHFNELLLSALAIFFAALAIWMLKHGAPEDGFKWASGIVGTIIGALLMKMQAAKDQPPDKGGNT